MMATLAQNFFRTNMVKLPVDWKPPGDQYNNAFKSGELVMRHAQNHSYRRPMLESGGAELKQN